MAPIALPVLVSYFRFNRMSRSRKALWSTVVRRILLLREMCIAIDNQNVNIDTIIEMFMSIFRHVGEEFEKKPKWASGVVLILCGFVVYTTGRFMF